MIPQIGKWKRVNQNGRNMKYNTKIPNKNRKKAEKISLDCCHWFLFISLFFGAMTYSQAFESTTEKTEISPDSVMKNKLFYFFTVINSDAKLKETIEKNPSLKEIYTAQLDRMAPLRQDCQSGKCYADAIRWSDKEIEEAGTALIKILEESGKSKTVVKKLKESRLYNLYHDRNDAAFIRTVWEYNAYGINRIFQVYLGGTPPERYAAIDSISYKQDDPHFVHKADSAITGLVKENQNKSNAPFYELPLSAALAVLYMNGRDEAARYEPLTQGCNAKAFRKVKNTDWASYKYNMLLVPGFGPEEEGVRLHEKGKARCEMAAERFKKGLAPFIVVSGGHVYPFRTLYSEAVEMRRYLIEEYDIPEEAIIIEPHARHTTTNIRNATRLLYRFNIPDTRPGLVVTDSEQVDMIENMAPRCIRDLGYVPYKSIHVLNENEVEFVPSVRAFQINLKDVLDP